RLHLAVRDVPEARWAVRSDPARWSVAECVAHLNLTALAFIPPLLAGVAQAKPLPDAATHRYRRDPVGWLVSYAAGPLPRVGRRRLGGVRTAASFVPSGDLSREVLMEEFDRLQSEQVALVRQGDGLALDSVRIASPMDARVKYSVYSAFVILPRHQQRHIEQAERVWAE